MTTDDGEGIRLQVLGSGGPMHAGGRGSAAYLLWRGAEPLLALDMGGDTPTAMAAAGVMPGQLPQLLISHVHPDHVPGLPDFVWGEITARRSRPLTVIGPLAAETFHDAPTLFRRLFSADGAFPDMAGVMEGRAFPLQFRTAAGDGSLAYADGGLTIRSFLVNHCRIPSLAYRIEVDGACVVFAGDQTMDDPGFVRFAQGAALMVAHAIATEEAASTPLARTVATPAAIGAAAQQAGVGCLVVGHLLGAPSGAEDAALWSLADLDGVLAGIGRAYRGEIVVARELDVLTLPKIR